MRLVKNTQVVLLAAALVWAAPAAAEPCGDVAQEGYCDGNKRIYCNANELQTEDCAQCCGWDGNNYDCKESCPDTCVEECLEGLGVFGCSLHNTHAWTCYMGDDGCTKREYVKCAENEVCDEAGSHKCVDKSLVNLCGGVPETGKCVSGTFKKCVAGAIQEDDCAGQGKSCVDGLGCSGDCPLECADGEKGCGDNGQAWSCQADPVTNCLVRASKNCGAKLCYEGDCKYKQEIDELEAAKNAEPEPEPDLGAVAEPPPTNNGGCYLGAGLGETIGETAVCTLATLLGFILFLSIARRREPARRRRREGKASQPLQR